MNKTKYTLLIVALLGSAVLGMAQTRPQLIVVGTTSTSVTLQLQAGSDALPDGFEVSFQSNRGEFKHILRIFGDDDCSQYSLQPGQISPPFTIDGVTNSECLLYSQTREITCATPYRFFAKAGDIVSTGVTVQTQLCN